MVNEVIGICPVCESKLLVTKMACPNCHTEISGEFALSKFSYLSKDELRFVEMFVLLKGNIKEMEKELEISYPTVKKYLDNIIVKMGYQVKSESKVDSEAILTKIKTGEMSVDEAIEALKVL
ncbi:MAG: DUF2089 domain-containing protein [Erysipelotrichaceae bacterium]|jgi:hypothetical protein|nr:DUF2089 domain-containing protein [Erysipelotrichaceae bacterium]MDD4643013.1 DUF2089 domain-containing protein [Erysipelotrichaceae bacterium]